MKRVFRIILSVVLALSLLPWASAWAAAPEEGAQPNMTILAGGRTAVHSGDGYVQITVTTTALTTVEELSQTVTVYRNEELVMYKKVFTEYNERKMTTAINFDATEGDIFEVKVTHRAKDGSVDESKTSTVFGDYHKSN